MAEDVEELVINALDLVVNTVKLSSNMKGTLKEQIYDTVSTIRTLFFKIKDNGNKKTSEIKNLTQQVEEMKAEIKLCRDKLTKGQPPPSLGETQELQRCNSKTRDTPSLIHGQVPTPNRNQETMPPGDRKLYSTVLKNKTQKQQFKITVKSKGNLTADAIKKILKTKINPTDIKVGIDTLKSLADGRVLITTSKKEEAEILENTIKEKCSEELEPVLHRRRNPRLIIRNAPEDITTTNAEETIIKQNPDLNLQSGDIIPKFCYTTKKLNRNLVIEVNAQTRKTLTHKKLKLGWMICKVEDYLVPNRCYRCSKYNHRQQTCKSEEICPLCTGKHKLKECTVNPQDYKCINCATYNIHNKNTRTCENHSSLDRNCPSLQAVLERYRENIDY
jgi:hypothetical protein